MKKFHSTFGLLTVLALAAFSSTANAQTYDLTFTAATPDDTMASGQLDVLNGIATGGYLDVTTGPAAGDYTLVTGTGTDSSFVYDDFVTPGSPDGFVDSTAGLLWSVSGSDGNSPEVNMWYNPTAQYGEPAETYSLWSAPGNLEAYGAAELNLDVPISGGLFGSASVPDSASTAGCLFAGFGCLIALRRKFHSAPTKI